MKVEHNPYFVRGLLNGMGPIETAAWLIAGVRAERKRFHKSQARREVINLEKEDQYAKEDKPDGRRTRRVDDIRCS